jgi:hypothetical protein
MVGFKDAITWARDRFVLVTVGRDADWMLHFCGTARQETVEIQAETTEERNPVLLVFVPQDPSHLPQ